MNETQLRKELVAACRRAAQAGLVGQTSGNFSLRLPHDQGVL
ncbi:MAG: class II aldolase/adducin family protein, partial [Deltaproteobacteria bacterium]|nr:class II aldolase/adducin family protein [Deltaproteobacteria bacterium]